MKKPLVILNWAIWNAAKWAFLMAGHLGGMTGPWNVGLGMVWFSFATILLTLFIKKLTPRRPDEWVPIGVVVLDVLLDLGLMVLLVWYGHWVLGLIVFLTASLGVHKRLGDERELEQPRKNPGNEEEEKKKPDGAYAGFRWVLTQGVLVALFWFGFIQGMPLARTFAIVLLVIAILFELVKLWMWMTDKIDYKNESHILHHYFPAQMFTVDLLYHVSGLIYIFWSGHWVFGMAWIVFALSELLVMAAMVRGFEEASERSN
jgi:hypothetical protein